MGSNASVAACSDVMPLGCVNLYAQAEFEAAMRQKQALEEDAAATQARMDAANALLGALAGEEARWTDQSKAFHDQIQCLTGERPLPGAPEHGRSSVGSTVACGRGSRINKHGDMGTWAQQL